MTAFSGSSALTSGPNYSYYSIPAAWVVAMLPHFYAVGLAGDKFKNTSPRQMFADLLAKKDKTALDKKIIRAESANYNSFETIGLYAAGVVAANVAGVPSSELNKLTGGYLASRALFNLLYIIVTSETVSALRSGAYISGIGIIFTLFIKAGLRLN